MNKGTEYEMLVQSIYQILHNTQEICTVNVLHDAEIEGKSGCKHQIDVYWEIDICDEIYRVAVECKNYTNKVEVGKIRDFLVYCMI